MIDKKRLLRNGWPLHLIFLRTEGLLQDIQPSEFTS